MAGGLTPMERWIISLDAACGDFYGRTSAGELIGPYDSQEELDEALEEAEKDE
jgi:hypothetical protein